MKHLTRSKDGIFYFQYWIPKQLSNSKYKGRIFKFSLRTTIRKDAIKQSYRLMGLILNLEERYKVNPNLYGDALTKMKTKLSEIEDIDNSIRAYQENLAHGLDVIEKLKEYEELDKLPTICNEEYQSQFNFNSFDMECYEIALRHIEENPSSAISVPDSNTFQKLADDMREVKDKIAPTYTNEQDPMFKVAFKQWQEDKKNFYRQDKQFKRNVTRIGLFGDFVGIDTRISELTTEQVTEFRAFIRALPKGVRLKDRDIDDIKSEVCNCFGDKKKRKTCNRACQLNFPRTIKDIFASVGVFLNWCNETSGKEYPINPKLKSWMVTFEAISSKNKLQKNKFSDEQLKLLFNNIAYIKDAKFPISDKTGEIVREWRFGKFSSRAMYWAQLIALFSGARQAEILQLEQHDIYKDKETGIWVMSICDDDIETEDEDKSTKTESSNRVIPIHSQLKDLDFLGYVDTIEKGAIFPDETRKDGTFSEYQDHYQWWRRTLGVKVREGKREKVDFHIFRGSFRTTLEDKGVSSKLLDKILGHSSPNDSTGDTDYSFTGSIELKAKALDKLKYDAIDFENMIRWNHCEFIKKKSGKKK